MKRGIPLLLAVFLSLLGYVYFVERKHPPKIPGEEKKIFQIQPEEIRKISIFRGKKRLALERKDSRDWRITTPVQDEADSMKVQDLARNLSDLSSLQTVPQKEKPESYGLTKSSLLLQVDLKSGSSFRLKLGKEDPTRQGYYAYNFAGSEIDLIPASAGQALLQPVDSWRNPAVLPFNQGKILKILLEKPKRKLLLVKVAEHWEISAPHHAKAKPGKVENLLSSLSSLQIMKFAGKIRPPKIPPVLTVSLWETGEKKPEVLTVEEKTKTGFLAETAGRNAEYYLPQNSLDFLSLNPDDFKDYRLLDFDEKAVTKIEINHEKKHYAFEKQQNNWVMTEPRLDKQDGVLAASLLADLKNLEEERKKKPPTSLPNPQTTITLWEEKTKIAEIQVGKRVFFDRQPMHIVRLEPAQKFAWTDADFLIRDIPVN